MNKFKKIFAIVSIFFTAFPFFSKVALVSKKTPERKQYVLYIKGYDWGAVSQKAVINLGKKVSSDAIKKEDFEVSVVLLPSGITSSTFGIKRGERNIFRAFISDSFGKEIEGESEYITLEFVISPTEPYSDPFVHNLLLNGNTENFYGLKIENDNLDIRITRLSGIVCPEATRFQFGMMSEDSVSVIFAFYENEYRNKASEEKSALILWMHGIAEGGNNPYIPLLGTKAVNLSEKEIQKYFNGGADLIIPQCPTGWLETTTKDIFGLRMWAPVDIEGSVNNMVKPVADYIGVDISATTNASRDENYVPPASVSYYTEVIRKIIEDYISRHPYIDKDRVYIGGCSAGGYMTVNMLLQYPDFFAGAFAACEAYPDSKITEKQLSVLSDIPLWFVHSENDTTIRPKNHDEDTVRRLKNLGKGNTIFTMYKDVRDLSGLWTMENGEPFQFDCHASWIYVLNNSPSENGLSLFEWLSRQYR